MGQKITNEVEANVSRWWATFNDSLANTDRCELVREATGITLSNNSILRIAKGTLKAHRKYNKEYNKRMKESGNGDNGTGPVKSYEDTLFTQYAKKQTLDDQVATALDNVRTTLERIEVVLETIAKVYNASKN